MKDADGLVVAGRLDTSNPFARRGPIGTIGVLDASCGREELSVCRVGVVALKAPGRLAAPSVGPWRAVALAAGGMSCCGQRSRGCTGSRWEALDPLSAPWTSKVEPLSCICLFTRQTQETGGQTEQGS
ncbi:unnamed protein product [Ostreobium quekettii]|uniref:Uncharacterized protein n=1 Tax=Ostreobium quekettii TaxID=121088 RepID=A0A8S1IQG4_9CHLO|nr:unnamed protein product [Ostreobium quekettii]